MVLTLWQDYQALPYLTLPVKANKARFFLNFFQ